MMDKYKKYLGVVVFFIVIAVMLVGVISTLLTKHANYMELKGQAEEISGTLEQKREAKANIQNKIKKLKESIISSQKKIYSPVEDSLGSDTLFFTLYNDVIEMVRANSVRVKSIDYQYNPQGDSFVAQGETYFVCDVNMEIVSNYINLGKLIQEIYQYPYYIRINNIEVIPYPKDKKILLSTISLRLYAHTSPEDTLTEGSDISDESGETIDGASVPIPQE